MINRWLVAALMAVVCLSAAEKVWQTGTIKEVRVDRPKFVVGVVPRDPANPSRSTAAPSIEKRFFVIETGTIRYEIRQDATSDTPRLDVAVGDTATFAIDKTTIWIKDARGREHLMKITKKKTI
jgi:hypothetical protein